MNDHTVFLFPSSGHGHQADYIKVIQFVVEESGFKLCPLLTRDISARIIPTLDFTYLGFIGSAVSTIRGHGRTVALFLRPQVCLKPKKPIHYAKRVLFGALKRHRGLEILTIVPFDLEPTLSTVATGWIYDPQLWDLPLLMPGRIETADASTVMTEKPTIALLGTLDRNKGFDRFSALWRADATVRERFRFIAAGRVAPDCVDVARDFVDAGGILIDERISDDAMMSLYDQSFAVWCAYDPGYDQASGIFGRAFQLGVPAIVTEGSLISRQAEGLGHAVLNLPADTAALAAAGSALCDWRPERLTLTARLAAIADMHHHSARVLTSAISGRAP
jgi:hypothetical protein